MVLPSAGCMPRFINDCCVNSFGWRLLMHMKNKRILTLTAGFLKSSWIFLLAILLRIALGAAAGIWFPADQLCDDVLMVEYASIFHHFNEPNLNTMAKAMAYPLFLIGVRISHLPYAVITGILWSAAAWTVRKLFHRISEKRLVGDLLFFYVLFLPIAFEQNAGLRLYRNSIIAPFTVLTFGLMALMICQGLFMDKAGGGKAEYKFSGVLWLSILSGIVFTFTYYIKEDGIWLMACLLFAEAVTLTAGICRLARQKKGLNRKKKAGDLVKPLIVLLVPLVVFLLFSTGYRMINRHFFGTAEINTRTEGSPGKFAQKVNAIASDEQSDEIWTPLDSIEQAIEASPTLKGNTLFVEKLMTNPYSNGDLRAEPLIGDFLTWAIRYAFDPAPEGGIWDEKAFCAFFDQVNQELDQAFRDGRLKKTDRIQLLPSGGAKSGEDIRQLFTVTGHGLLGSIVLKGYQPGIRPGVYEYPERVEAASLFSNTHYLNDYTQGQSIRDNAAAVTKFLFIIYRVINVVLLGAAFAGIVLAVLRLIGYVRKKTDWTQVRTAVSAGLISLCFFGLGVVYTFSISWFASFLFAKGIDMSYLNYYTVSLPALLVFAYGFGVTALISSCKKSRIKPEKDEM